MSVTISTATARPHAPLRRWIGGYSGSHLEGFESGFHRALPSPAVVMNREWKELAGCPPSTWLDEEELPFVQDIASPDSENW
jgi:hypothetical protein